MAAIIEKARKGNKTELLALTSGMLRESLTLSSALLASEELGESVTAAALEYTLERFFGGAYRTPDEIRDAMILKTVGASRAVINKENPKAFKAPAAKNFAVVHFAPSGEGDFGALAPLPPLQRFLAVLGAFGGLSEKAISDTVGISIESVKAAAAYEEANLLALSGAVGRTVSAESLKTIATLAPDPERIARLEAKISEIVAPVSKETEKKNRGFLFSVLAVLGVAILLALAIFLIVKVIGTNNDSTSGSGNGSGTGTSGSGEIFDDVTIDTSKTYYADIVIKDYGTIRVRLDHSAAPITVSNFVNLAREGFYNGRTFHRIIEGFMMQGGSSDNAGYTGSDQLIKGEFAANGINNPLHHDRGVISMARAGYSYDSASSQFFIVHEDNRESLDGLYAAFGYVVTGMDIVDRICEEAVPVDGNGKILLSEQPVIEKVIITESN